MPHRIDIARLRKERGLSQNELARKLKINQSFLSAIENGRSPIPPEKEEMLMEIFDMQDLSPYISGCDDENASTKKMSEMTDSDLFNQLLQRFHKQAHSNEEIHHHHDHHTKIEELEGKVALLFDRNESLMNRNDRLAEDNENLRRTNDSLREEIDRLRAEIFRLKNK